VFGAKSLPRIDDRHEGWLPAGVALPIVRLPNAAYERRVYGRVRSSLVTQICQIWVLLDLPGQFAAHH
jgi:hypothetical protein